MKKLLTVIMLGMFSLAAIGCEASGSIDDDDMNDGGSYSSKKTTRVDDDGDRTVKTEVKKSDRD